MQDAEPYLRLLRHVHVLIMANLEVQWYFILSFSVNSRLLEIAEEGC